MVTRRQIGRYIIHSKRFIKFRILHVEDSPHRIALGASVGIFAAYLPPIGLHMIIALLLCIILRANKFVALTLVWISNPLTIIPVYYPCYLLGQRILSFFTSKPRLTVSEIQNMLYGSSEQTGIHSIFTISFWQHLFGLLAQIGIEVFLGGLIIGVIFSTLMYFILRRLVTWYRKNHPVLWNEI